MNDTLLIFTGYTYNQIRLEGESRAWTLSPDNARNCTYAVLCFNVGGDEFRKEQPQEHTAIIEHGTAFLVGKISGVVPSREVEGRWVIRFSEIASVSVENIWSGHQNPITYAKLRDLAINPDALDFRPVGTLA